MAIPATSSFTHQKRLFLLNKLDEVLKLWASGSGQGCFNFGVKNGNPTLQYNLQLDMEDLCGTVPAHYQPPQPRHRGPARRARDRQRAAQHQAAIAAAERSAGNFPEKRAVEVEKDQT